MVYVLELIFIRKKEEFEKDYLVIYLELDFRQNSIADSNAIYTLGNCN